jgi:small-conductance mechanosensitive channel
VSERPSLNAVAAFLLLLAVGVGGSLSAFAPVLAQDAGLGAQEGAAQNNGADAPTGEPAELSPAPIPAELQNDLQRWMAHLDTIEAGLAAETITLTTLERLRDEVAELRAELAANLAGIVPIYDEQVAILAELNTDAEVQVETPQVVDLRQRILDLNAQIQPVALLQARAEVLRRDIADRRATVFATQLFSQSHALVSPTLWGRGLAGLPEVARDFEGLFVRSWQAVKARASPQAFAGLGALVLLLVALALPARRWALRRSVRKEGHDAGPLEKLMAALRIVFASAGIPAIGFLLLSVALDATGGLSLRAREFAGAFAVCVTLYFAISGIVRAVLAPGRPNWRLVPIDEVFAARAAVFIRLAAFAYAVGEFLRIVARGLFAPLPSIQLVETVPVLLAAVFVLAAVRAIVKGLNRPEGEGETPSLISVLWRWTIPLAALVALSAVVAQLLGYLALAAFLIDRLVWTAVVLAGLHLAARTVEEGSNAVFQEDGRATNWAQQNIGLSPSGLGQFGVLLSGVIKLVLIVAAASFIIAPFGVETGQFAEIFGSVFTGIELGGFSFSLTSLLIALALVFLGIIVTRGVQGWLENRYLPRTSIDTGLKASISTGIGYIGIVIAAAVGLSYLGLNLENIALVAGALSVGIGFGLQSIVSNFVSGLILLAERPFKQGDWIVVGEEQGIVKSINVRATELQTFDRATVLIPNSDFIAGTVKNRVHRDTLGRIDVPVGVGYDSDPQKVKEILLEVANAHPMTLSFPEPAAFFVEFGASSLDFMLFAYLADVGNGYGVRSDIRFEIFRRFKEEGIEIPFAQSDVTIRNLDGVLAALAKAGIAAPEGLGAGDMSGDEGIKQTGVSTVPAPDGDRVVETDAEPTPEDGPVGR